MTGHKTITPFAVLLVAILAAWGCQSREERVPQGPSLKLSLAIHATPYSGLIAVAEDKGFFRESGLEVSITQYPSGLSAVEALCRGEAQLATAADFVFVAKMNEEPSLRVVASIGLSNGNKIVARKDRNIHEPADLKGKTVGFSLNTTTEYYLNTFLLANHIPASEVTAVNIAPAKIAEAIVNGEVDAISTFDINGFEAMKRLGGNAVSWEAQNTQDFHWIMAAKESLTLSPEPIKRFLRALVNAEAFSLAHRDEAENLVMRKWGLDPEFMRQSWGRTRLNVSLNQSLITSLENLARWRMNKESKVGDPPNFLNYIYIGALEEVDPKAVTIFR